MSAAGTKQSSYTLNLIPGTNIALFHWVGPISLDDRKQNARRMAEFCNSNGVTQVIIDGRDQISETDIIDAYEFGKDVPIDMRGLAIAVVHRVDDQSLKFIETVAFNRGARSQSFHDLEAARDWLESSSA